MGSRWPPPRDDGYRQGNRSSEAYRPSYSSGPPPAERDSGGNRNGRYEFRNHDQRYPDSRRDTRGSGFDVRPPQGDFTFRSDRPSGVQESYESFRGRSNNDTYRPGPSRRNNGPGRGGSRGGRGGRGGFRPPRPKERAADRLFLHKKHDDDAEDLLGDTTQRATYRNPDELSEDDEAAMDISDDSDADDNQPAAKRVRLDNDDSVPKWSNPDPYTALPPPDESQRKKKDVVQMIRKARVEADAQKQSDNKEAAEFISFDFTDDEDEDDHSNVMTSLQDTRVLNAPTGPRSTLSGPLPSSLPPKPPTAPGMHSSLPHQIPAVQDAQPAKVTPAKKAQTVDLSASTNLGSRKRTADDRIKERPHQPLQKGKKMRADATVESAWKPKKDEDACPWALVDHSSEPNMGVRLHKELVDFFEYVRPRDFEEAVRHNLVRNLAAHARRWQKTANVKAFGSFMSGLYLPTADMDLVICSDQFLRGGSPLLSAKSYLYKLRAYLTKNNVPHGNDVDLIIGAKVPLVKYIDEATGLRVDISFENLTGIDAIDTFMEWKKQYPAMPTLVAIIKHFLCMRGLNEPVNGGIGGFSVICMVVNLFNNWPEVQSGTLNPRHHLGESLMRFFRLYGKEFDYETTAISMNPPRFVPKHSVSKLVYKNMDRLSIIDPNNSANDISGGSSNYPLISRCFASAYDDLQKRMYVLAQGHDFVHGHNTILAPILGGNYKAFRVQRAYLQGVFDSKNLGAQAGHR